MAIDLYLDLKACFDMMVEAYHNLACQCHGADIAYLCLHAQTHQLMWYYVCHKFGISKEYNTFEQHPWHGAGQGTADAALHYIVLSDTLIDDYHAKVAPTMMCNPTTTIKSICSLKAVSNDVVLHAADLTAGDINKLLITAQTQLRWWNQLVQVTRGALNPKKCCGMLYQWKPDTKGILCLCWPEEERHPFTLSNEDHGQEVHILNQQEGTWYLGLYLMMDCNTKPMETHLWEKATLYTQAFQQTPMNHHEARVSLVQIMLSSSPDLPTPSDMAPRQILWESTPIIHIDNTK